MSVARFRHILDLPHDRLAGRRRATVRALVVLAAIALGLGFAIAALPGLAVVVALLASIAAVTLSFRLSAVERSHAALLVSVADLTTRLARLEAAPVVVEPESVPGSLTSAIDESDHAAPLVSVVATPTSAGTVDPSASPAGHVTVAHDQRGDEAAANDTTGTPDPAAPTDSPEQGHVASAGEDAVNDGDPSLPLTAEPAADPVPGDLVDDRLAAVAGDAVPDADAGEAMEGIAVEDADTVIPSRMPGFALTALRGDLVTDADLAGRPAVVVFWRPGCDHSRRLTPELVAWESLQGPRLVVFAACDGPTAFRAGLPGMVILDPAFSVGQALGAPGTPAALPIDVDGQPVGPVVTGGSAVTTLLLDAMRDWASAEPEPAADEDVPLAGQDDGSEVDATAGGPEGQNDQRRPTVLLRRVEESTNTDTDAAPDWDTGPATRRVG